MKGSEGQFYWTVVADVSGSGVFQVVGQCRSAYQAWVISSLHVGHPEVEGLSATIVSDHWSLRTST